MLEERKRRPADELPPYHAQPEPGSPGRRASSSSEASRDAVKLLRDTLPIIPALQPQLVKPRTRNWVVPLVVVAGLAILAVGGYLSLRLPLFHPKMAATQAQPTEPAAAAANFATRVQVRVTQDSAVVVRPLTPGIAHPKIIAGARVYGKDPVCPPRVLPPGARRVVKAELVINEKGSVEDLRIVEGEKVLAEAVTAALSHWHYNPFQIYEQVAAVRLPVTVVFAADPAITPGK